MALITLEEAVHHLRLDGMVSLESGSGGEDDGGLLADLVAKMEEASAVVVNHLKTSDSSWDEDTTPYAVKAAIKLVLADMWENRGDTKDGDYISFDGPAWRVLNPLRDPAIA